MKFVLISLAILGLVSHSVMAKGDGFNPEFVAKIIETAQEEGGVVFDEDSAKPVERSSRATLSCTILPAGGTPSTVHALQPQDVKVVGAIGDSLTAANGAKARSIIGLLDECRGVSWAIGCESDLSASVTFATILKKFSPGLVGCSTGTGKQNSSVANLNLADPGDTSFDMPGQARLLVQRIRSTVADADDKWKIINFFIGGNDLCDACKDSAQTTANFRKNIESTLDYFEANLPRTLVNMVLTLDVSGIEILSGTTCRNMQSSFCDCALSTSYRPTLKALKESYVNTINELIKSGKYNNNPLFTVNMHHFMTQMTPPLTSSGAADYSYFAPDCFHFSVKGHEAAATELWNSMVTPDTVRADRWSIGSSIKCPTTTYPYIYTHVNSKQALGLKSLIKTN